MVTLTRRSDPRFIIGTISGSHFISHLYLLAYPPLFPLLQAEFGLSSTQLGLLVTAIYVPTLLFQIPIGKVVDRIGAKVVLVLGLVTTSVGIILSGIATTYWILLCFAFISGIGQAVYHPTHYSILDTVTEPSTEGTAFSMHTFGGFAGFAAAPILIGGIGIVHSWQFALLLVGSLGLLYGLFVFISIEAVYTSEIASRNGHEGDRENFGIRANRVSLLNRLIETIRGLFTTLIRAPLLLMFSFYFVSMMAIVGLQSFLVIYGISVFDFTESQANMILTAFLIAQALGILAGGPLANRSYFRAVAISTFAASATGVWVGVAMTPFGTFLLLVMIFAFVGFSMGMALPSRDRLANSLAVSGETGTSFGFFFTGLSLGAVLSPPLLGYVIDVATIQLAFIMIGAFLIIAAGVVGATTLLSRATSTSVSPTSE